MRKISLVVLISFCVLGCGETNNTENLLSQIDHLKMKNDSLIKILIERKPDSNYWFDAQYDGEELIVRGIKDPAKFIKDKLRKRTELIPLKAVLGGTMHFGKIQLLSSEWLIADFNDGHVQGRAIYQYSLSKKKQMEFEILSSIGPE